MTLAFWDGRGIIQGQGRELFEVLNLYAHQDHLYNRVIFLEILMCSSPRAELRPRFWVPPHFPPILSSQLFSLSPVYV